jgi:hypothetical protein
VKRLSWTLGAARGTPSQADLPSVPYWVLHQSRLSEVLDGTRRKEARPKARGCVNRMLNDCPWSHWTIISSDEVAYIKTLRKHRDHVWVKCTIIEARDLLLVPHILAIAVEGQDKARSLLFLVAFRDIDEKLALDAVTLDCKRFGKVAVSIAASRGALYDFLGCSGA